MFKNSKSIGEYYRRKELELRPVVSTVLTHVEGLPVPKGAICKVMLCQDKLIILFENNEYNVSIERLIGCAQLNEREIQKQVKRNIGGAIVGGTLFGATGAIIGGMPNSKARVNVKSFLTIAFANANDGHTNIIFGPSSLYEINQFSIKFMQHIKNIKGNIVMEL